MSALTGLHPSRGARALPWTRPTLQREGAGPPSRAPDRDRHRTGIGAAHGLSTAVFALVKALKGVDQEANSRYDRMYREGMAGAPGDTRTPGGERSP